MSVVNSPTPARALRRDGAPAAPRTRHLEVVRSARRRPSRRVLATIFLFALFALLMVPVAFHVRLAQRQQHIDDLNRRAEAASVRYDHLRLTVDELSAPDRIIREARSLGMVAADNPVWLPSTSAGLATPSANDDAPDTGYLDVKPYLSDAP